MIYSLEWINEMVQNNPSELVRKSDEMINERIVHAADMICQNMYSSPVVLLSGPSGSGKTTTAKKLSEELSARGIKTTAVSMDNYFKTINLKTIKRDENGEIDYESPDCLGGELLNEHFSELSRGNEIKVPSFNFPLQRRSTSKFSFMRLGENELAIFEGIHALNDIITDAHPEAFTLYISAASDIESNSEKVFYGPWMRMVRRIVRDSKFRGTSAELTLSLWDNVLRGERLYINPFLHKAKLMLDSSLPYEVPVMKLAAMPILEGVGCCTENFDELQRVLNALRLFNAMDESLVAPESLLREFLGGGVYKY
jgi:uridine kinase